MVINFNTIPMKLITLKTSAPATLPIGTFVLGRSFTTSNYMLLPRKNDQDRLIEKIDKLEEQFNEMDRNIEELTKDIVEDEEDVNSDGEETELSIWLKEREEEKDNIVAINMEERDEALFVQNDERKDRSLSLEVVRETARRDIETLDEVMEQCPQDNPAYDRAEYLIEKLERLEDRASRLYEKWHENDLPPISSLHEESGPIETETATPTSHFPQDSSDIEQTDFNSFDPFDE